MGTLTCCWNELLFPALSTAVTVTTALWPLTPVSRRCCQVTVTTFPLTVPAA